MEKSDNMENKDLENSMPSLSDEQSSNSWESLEIPKDETPIEEIKPQVEWDDILGSGALLKKIIKKGNPDSRPKRLMLCTINYICKLEDGTEVEKINGLKLQQGDLEVVQGLDILLTLMNIGEICVARVEPRLGYGAKGDPPRIPPNAKLEFEVELLDADFEDEDTAIRERKNIGNKKKQRGNWWYGRGEYTFAIQCYRRALDYLDEIEGGITKPEGEGDQKRDETSDAELQELLEDRLSVHNNMAAAQMKQGATDTALQSLQNVLRCQPNNVKALYRKSMILKEKNDIPEAIKYLHKAKSIEPDNQSILKEIKTVTALLQKHKNYEKELAKRMFNNKIESSKPQREKKRTSPLFWASLVGSIAVGVAGIAAWRFKFS